MPSRVDKYNSDVQLENRPLSRSERNQQLYNSVYTNTTYTEFDKIETEDNVVDLSNIDELSNTRRESYQKTKIFNNDIGNNEMSFEELRRSFDDELNTNRKVQDINEILESARKNRSVEDENEKIKRIKSAEYNILSDLSHEKLKEYHEQKKKMTPRDEENLEELINTITSNSLRSRIDDELLMDLMPEKDSETIISKNMLDEIEEYSFIDNDEIAESEDIDLIENNKENNKDESSNNEEKDKIDNSFYTKTLDLTEEDLDDSELDDEDKDFLEDNDNMLKKILLVVFTLFVLGVIAYIIYTLV